MATAPEALPETFLEGLSAPTRDTLLSLTQALVFKGGETIFGGGDPCTHVYIVKSGQVGLTIYIPHKGPVTLLTVEPDELFGWSAMVPPRIETATARAMEDTEVLAIDASELFDRCEKDPRFGYEIYRALTAVVTLRLRATRLQLADVFAHP